MSLGSNCYFTVIYQVLVVQFSVSFMLRWLICFHDRFKQWRRCRHARWRRLYGRQRKWSRWWGRSTPWPNSVRRIWHGFSVSITDASRWSQFGWTSSPTYERPEPRLCRLRSAAFHSSTCRSSLHRHESTEACPRVCHHATTASDATGIREQLTVHFRSQESSLAVLRRHFRLRQCYNPIVHLLVLLTVSLTDCWRGCILWICILNISEFSLEG